MTLLVFVFAAGFAFGGLVSVAAFVAVLIWFGGREIHHVVEHREVEVDDPADRWKAGAEFEGDET